MSEQKSFENRHSQDARHSSTQSSRTSQQLASFLRHIKPSRKYRFRVHRLVGVRQTRAGKLSNSISASLQNQQRKCVSQSHTQSVNKSQPPQLRERNSINHPMHFLLTLVTFGLWGVCWWYIILKSRGHDGFISALDDDYWSYLIEREQPPAALYPIKIAKEESQREYLDA